MLGYSLPALGIEFDARRDSLSIGREQITHGAGASRDCGLRAPEPLPFPRFVAETQLGHAKNVRVQRDPFLLARDFEAGVIPNTLAVAKKVSNAGSFPCLPIAALGWGLRVEDRFGPNLAKRPN